MTEMLALNFVENSIARADKKIQWDLMNLLRRVYQDGYGKALEDAVQKLEHVACGCGIEDAPHIHFGEAAEAVGALGRRP